MAAAIRGTDTCTWYPADTIHWINVGLTLVQRRRRWTSVNPTLIQRLVSAGYAFCSAKAQTQQTRYETMTKMSIQCWASVVDDDPALNQHRVIVSCLLGRLQQLLTIQILHFRFAGQCAWRIQNELDYGALKCTRTSNDSRVLTVNILLF